MRNSSLAPLPSQAFGFGNNEYQVLPSSDISSVLDSKLLWSLPKRINDEETRGASSGINHLQSMVNPPTGYEDVPHLRFVQSERPLEQSKKHRQVVLTTETTQLNERKRPLDARGDKSATEEAKTAPTGGWKINKRKRVLGPARQFLPHAERSSVVVCKTNVTGKRSQKIGDRITALQKLVSPYGKTDTASVLQEASLYIKLLQEQIQNLFQMLSSSYNSIRTLQVEENGRKQTDLRSRGLCLVAVSSIQEATKEAIVDDHSIHHCAY